MPTVIPPVRFKATGVLQLYIVPETGSYQIAAAGAQGGGPDTAPGGKGAMVRGVFHLRAGEILHLVVGRQGTPGMNLPAVDTDSEFPVPAATNETATALRGGGGGGGTFVWRDTAQGYRPTRPLLAAGGGGGGGSFVGGDGIVTLDAARNDGYGGRNGAGGASDRDSETFYYTGGGGAGWLSPGAHGAGPTYCRGGGHWEGGEGAVFGGYQGGQGGFGGGGGGSFFGAGSGGGGGYSGGAGGGGRKALVSGGGSSYNAGREQLNAPGFQPGDGFVTITAVPTPLVLLGRTDTPASVTAPAPTVPDLKPRHFTESLTLKLLQQHRWFHLPN